LFLALSVARDKQWRMVNSRPKLLDLFCGEGGAGMGYHRAGFDVVGVDIAARAGRYPFEFHRADAIRYLAREGHRFDVIHASPPCQVHSVTRTLPRSPGRPAAPSLFDVDRHPDLVDSTRAALVESGKPYVIENVPGAPLLDPVTLCGSMWPDNAVMVDGVMRGLRRHRLFESNTPLTAPGPCDHRLPSVGVYGRLTQWSGNLHRAYLGSVEEAAAVMGIDWMTPRGLALAIPPVYTAHLGALILAGLSVGRSTVDR
jgi:DNA (cytosine-5)-methyltransferase 1